MKRFIHYIFTSRKRISLGLIVLAFGLLFFGFDKDQNPMASVQVVKCYPNPATSFVNFEFSKTIDKTNTLLVFSFVGKKMTEMPVSNNKITVTLNEYYRGIYVFQLRDKGGNIIESGKFSVIK